MSKTVEKQNVFVPRITQLDASEFDKEIRKVLFSQLNEISNYLKPGALNSIKLEINLIIDILILYYSLVTKNSTFGQELLKLKYKDKLSKKQLTFYTLINIVVPYVVNKYENNSSRIENISIKKALDKVGLFMKICITLNFLLFLREGKYPTIADRFLGLKYCPVNKLNTAVGYNFMTRELLWHGFMELLMFILPLINYKAIKRNIKKSFSSGSTSIKSKKSVVLNSDTKCAVCDDFPILPCVISSYCEHVACYYCLKSNLLADEKFVCPLCGETSTGSKDLKFLTG